MEGLTIRAADASDLPRIAELISGDPGKEAIGILGNRRLARRLGMALVMSKGSAQGWEHSVMGDLDGTPVGVLQAGSDIPEFSIRISHVWLALRTLGPIRLVTLLPRLEAQSRVQPERPEGSYYIAEIDVDPAYRNRGIGGALLDWAESQAREQGFKQMSLTTTTANPARHLYERHGFYVAETKTDADYERYTGIEGRLLMLKDLDQP